MLDLRKKEIFADITIIYLKTNRKYMLQVLVRPLNCKKSGILKS